MKLPVKILLMAVLFCAFGGVVVGTFWIQDWRYSLPTPRPAGLRQPPVQAGLALPASLAVSDSAPFAKPLFLHFYNPDCPCSRFNLPHIRRLISDYGDRARFVVVLEGEEASSLRNHFASAELNCEAVVDSGGSLARACGVYSTPQAVLVAPGNRLYYRGNYNSGRYCTDPASAYARLACLALLAGSPAPKFGAGATTAYGCSLPTLQTPSREKAAL